jgi:hypothetical protein
MAWVLLANSFHPIDVPPAKLEVRRGCFYFGGRSSLHVPESKRLEGFFHGSSFVKFPLGMDM